MVWAFLPPTVCTCLHRRTVRWVEAHESSSRRKLNGGSLRLGFQQPPIAGNDKSPREVQLNNLHPCFWFSFCCCSCHVRVLEIPQHGAQCEGRDETRGRLAVEAPCTTRLCGRRWGTTALASGGARSGTPTVGRSPRQTPTGSSELQPRDAIRVEATPHPG
jgi:hypothetical protein